MSQRGLRRREPVIGVRKTKPPHPSPSPCRRTPPPSLNKSKHVTILKPCSSAPALLPVHLNRDGDDGQEFRMEETFLRSKTISEAFSSSPSLSAFSPQKHGYEVRHKVLLLFNRLCSFPSLLYKRTFYCSLSSDFRKLNEI